MSVADFVSCGHVSFSLLNDGILRIDIDKVSGMKHTQKLISFMSSTQAKDLLGDDTSPPCLSWCGTTRVPNATVCFLFSSILSHADTLALSLTELR